MSSSQVLLSVSEQIREILWEAINADQASRNLLSSPMDILFLNPTETAKRRSSSNNTLSLWLYQVTENEHLKNQPITRSNGPTSFNEIPLALNLYYLVTPFGPTDGNTDGELLLLGKVMQAMYDNPTLIVQAPLNNVFEELRVILCRLTLEELTRIWEALKEPYRLSICYQIRVTRVDSNRVQQGARVVESHSNYGETPLREN